MKNKKFHTKAAFLFAAISLTMPALRAQITGVAEAQALYPDAGAMYLNKSQEYRIFVENGVLTGTCINREQIYINREAGIGLQKRSVYSNNFVEASNIKACTYIPKGKKYEKKEVEKIEQKDNPSRSSFYDDQRSYSIVYPAVQPGAVLDLSYQQKYTEPRFMGSYYWVDYIPSMQSELVITLQKGIEITYKMFNCEGEAITFTKEEKKTETVYRWKQSARAPGMPYSDSPDFRYYEPHIVFYITSYIVDGKPQQLLGTPANLYSWYNTLQKNVNKTEDAKLKHIADSLVAGITSEEEKVKKIFYWVQDNISYVAFEDGLGGFIPRDAGLVCTRKYGDCKDMASIIHEMLRMAGVESYLTWIGSRDIPYTYQDVPTPAVDNHMIAAYRDKNGGWHFLDGTGKHAAQELYTSFIQGKEAMIGLGPDKYELVTVPVKDTSVSQTVDSITVSISGNIVNGKGRAVLTGYDKLEYVYSTEHMSKTERLDYFKEYFSKGNNKVSFADVVETDADRSLPLSIAYNFTLPDYARKNQDEIYINLNMDEGLGLEQLNKTRKVPLDFKHITKKQQVTILHIPEGYKVSFVPPNTSSQNNVVGFRSTYTIKGNTIIHICDFYINTLILKVEDFDKFNKVLAEQTKSNKQTISLTKQ